MYVNLRPITILAAENQSVCIGDDCIISHGVMIRTADPHLIYDCKTLKRVNPSNSVIVGDHVWLGQSVLILKGTLIGSGSIIGANSVVSGKKVVSNSVWAGNPARCIKKGVFWLRDCTNPWDQKQSEESIIQTEENKKKFTFIGSKMLNFNRLDFVEIIGSKNRDKFAI